MKNGADGHCFVWFSGIMSIDGYELIQPFTVTSTGTLWLARSTNHEQCLIRFLSLDQARELTPRLDVLVSLKNRHLAGIRDVVKDDNRIGIVLDWVDGKPLNQWMHLPGALVQMRIRAVLRDIALGLDALHSQGLAHGDLTPSNVIVHEDAAVLIDTVMGQGYTPGYAAPEIMIAAENDEPITFDTRPADIWAWGQIARQLGFEDAAVEATQNPNPSLRPTAKQILESDAIAAVSETYEIPMEVDTTIAAGDLLRLEAAKEQTIQAASGGARRGRHRREKPRRTWVRTAVATIMVLAGALALTGWWLRPAPQIARPADTAGQVEQTEVRCPSSGEAITIVSDLTTKRNRAIVEGDAELLGSVIAADSEVMEKDEQLIEAMAQAGVSVTDLTTAVSDVRVVECNPLTIDATFMQAPHERCQGGVCETIPEQPAAKVRLTFEGPPWRVTLVQSLEPESL